MEVDRDVSNEAAALLTMVTTDFHDRYENGSMTCTIYDTAWTSMIVCKDTDGHERWWREDSWHYILHEQDRGNAGGGWETIAAATAPIDGILNTAAALLSLCQHRARPLQVLIDRNDLNNRIHAATQWLARLLQTWEPTECRHVAFELLVPKLLELLEPFDVHFVFEGRPVLEALRSAKLASIDLDELQRPHSGPQSVVHSLEALIGMINFDSVRHHQVHGHFMASPASTAAYLAHSSVWDNEAAAYLNYVIDMGAGRGSGALPSAFPSSLFEMTWVVTALIENGFSLDELGTVAIDRIRAILEAALERGKGLVGFASYVAPDADDTAKAITCMHYLGNPVDPARLVRVFGKEGHFETYAGERVLSITTNCNILTALLASDESRKQYANEISNILKLLCRWGGYTANIYLDKWHQSSYYTLMKLSHCLSRALLLWKSGLHFKSCQQVLDEDVPRVLCSILIHVLKTQQASGAWCNSPEITSYAMITVGTLREADWAQTPLSAHAESSLRRGRGSLLHAGGLSDELSECRWIEKVSYGSPRLAKAYQLAALRVSELLAANENMNGDHKSPLHKFDPLQRLPLLQEMPKWLFHGSSIEASYFTQRVIRTCQAIIPNDAAIGQHLQFVPITWVLSSYLSSSNLNCDVLLDMMVLSSLLYTIDKHMEAVVTKYTPLERAELKRIVGNLPAGQWLTAENAVDETLSGFLRYILLHPRVLTASLKARQVMEWHLRAYLQAHLTQTEDYLTRQAFYDGKSPGTVHPRHLPEALGHGPLLQWIRHVSGAHTGGGLAFHFFLAVTGFWSAFASPQVQYLGEIYCTHIEAVSRLQNDYGSVQRDLEEANLNSIEFLASQSQQGTIPEASQAPQSHLRNTLLDLAAFERVAADQILRSDLPTLLRQPAAIAALEVFNNAVNVYGQMYVMRDYTCAHEGRTLHAKDPKALST